MSNQLSQPIRGARDFYPEDLALRNWLFNSWREVAKLFGYEEIDAPSLESFDLYAAKSGEELVNQQMYVLSDRDERKLGVRPELTPSYARLVAQKQGELVFPLRWMMFGEVWRYEKPQTGRSRDFWQWELNIVGGEENAADAEVIAVAAKAMEKIGLSSSDVVFRLNDRRFMQQQLEKMGVGNDLYPAVLKAIDRKEKITPEEFFAVLTQLGLSPETITALNRFLDTPNYSSSPKLVALFELLKAYGVADYVQFDPTIVRGLTYYTGTVFECFDRSKTLRSVFGGGRFDDLVETFGGGKMPAVGFAIGDVVVTELLNRLGKRPSLATTPTQVLVTVFSPDLFSQSVEIAKLLRQSGINAELYPETGAKLDKQLRYASRKNLPWAVIVGPDEVAANSAVLKNLTLASQSQLPREQLAQAITNPS